MPARMFGAVIAALLLTSPIASSAEDKTCQLRCATLHQIFEDQTTATIPLICDGDAIRCRGTGTLQINRETVPTRITALFSGAGVALTIDTDQGFLKPSFGPGESFDLGLDRDAASQSKSFPVRWQSSANASPNMNRYLGGHFKLTVDHYAPAPPRAL